MAWNFGQTCFDKIRSLDRKTQEVKHSIILVISVVGCLIALRYHSRNMLFYVSVQCNVYLFFFKLFWQLGRWRRAIGRAMAAVHHPGYPSRYSLYWDETECLDYYGMLSLHEVFEIVGSQLTESDVEVLSFLLNETCSAPHPLDPTGWTVEPHVGNPGDSGVSPSPELLKTWRRLKPQSSQAPLVAPCKPTSGPELFLELEKQGYLSDGNLEPLLQLLRVLTRHDLLPLVSHKKRRTGEDESPVCHYQILR